MSKPTFLEPLICKGAGRCELVSAAGGAVLATQVEPAFDSKTRKRGLLGRDSVAEDYALIIAPCSSIHTFFMRCAIDAVFVSKSGQVIKTCRSVKPWRMAGAWGAFAVIEAAAGFVDRHKIVPGQGVALREIPHRRRATDVLPPMVATPATEVGIPTVRPPDPSKDVTLADIIARKMPVGWFESVAIVQELCKAVLDRGMADAPRVPELKDIALTSVGGVALRAEGPVAHSPARRASLVLLALSPEAQLPLELRLLVLGELSPTPRFASLKELHTALEYFERPDRPDIVRRVYDRFLSEPLSAPAQAANSLPLLELPPPPQPWPHRPRTWKWVWDGIGIAVVVLIVGGAIWEWQRPEGQWMRSGVAEVSRAASAAGDKIVQAARRVRNELEALRW